MCSSRTFMNGSGIGRASSFVCLYGHMAMDDTTNSMQIVYSRPRIYDEEEAVTRGVASIVAQRTVGDRGWDPVTAWCSSRIRGRGTNATRPSARQTLSTPGKTSSGRRFGRWTLMRRMNTWDLAWDVRRRELCWPACLRRKLTTAAFFRPRVPREIFVADRWGQRAVDKTR